MQLSDLVNWMDSTLRTSEVADYSGAVNGLQVENRRPIRRVAAAVDACEAVLSQAVSAGCDLLLVHHGLFWQTPQPWTGPTYRKMLLCLENNLAVYSSHLPLDMHPQLGNNAILARLLGMPPGRPFLEFKGQPVGLEADWEISLADLLVRVEAATGQRPHCAPGGPGRTRRVGVVTGGTGAEVAAAAAWGVDTFITGEGPHWSYPLAEELGVNLIYAGHYATETFGVRALAEALEKEFGLPWEFIDHPTGL